MTSQNVKMWATPVDQSAIRLATVDQQTIMAGDWVYDWTDAKAVKVTQNGADVSAVYGGDWTVKGVQANLDLAFERRTFAGNVTIKGDLPAGFELNMADARGNVTFENGLFGRFSVDGFGASIDGTLTIKGNLNGAVLVQGLDRTGGFDGQQNKINAIVVEGSTGAFTDVYAEDIGDITIRGNMSGIFSTDVTRGNAWTPTSNPLTATGYVDVEGKIGNITIGYNAAGASTGGSIINGTFQGMSGIGNIAVGGDITGSAPNSAVFITSSNPGAAPNDVRNYGSANIGTLTVRGDVDLDNPSDRLIHIDGNGTYGNITVQGLTTTSTTVTKGAQIGTTTSLIPGSEAFVRILSPFTDTGFTIDTSKGQKLQTNYDPDGTGPLDDTYRVTSADVSAGAQVYDLTTKALVAAKIGDRVPALSGGLPVIDSFGNVLYRQNTALFEGKTQTTPVYAPDVTTTTILSGNRGNLNGVFNNFGRIEISGLLGAGQSSTGTISWTDSVDMNFGGVTVNSSGAANNNVIASQGTIGQITIANTSGATSDLIVSGNVGGVSGAANNANTAFVRLAGVTSTGFEDVLLNSTISATEITNGLAITTIGGSATVSPSIRIDGAIELRDGTNEGSQKALLALNTGMVNSTIALNGSITVDNGGNTGNGSAIEDITLAADYVQVGGTITANTIGKITLTGGSGIGSGSDTGVLYTGGIVGNTVGAITASAMGGNVNFNPGALDGIATPGTNQNVTPKASVASITLTTAGSNNGGDISLGSGALFNANIGNVTLTAGHKLFLGEAGAIIDNPGNVTLDLATSGNVGDVSVTTTTGNINNALIVQGNAGNITYTAGVAVVDKSDLYAGPEGDIVKAGNITANQTIWGNRGATNFTVANTPVTYTAGGVSKSVTPAGTITANLGYAGASTVGSSANALTVVGSGAVVVNMNVGGIDDNNDGVTSSTEIGHGGNSSLTGKGAVTFNASTAAGNGVNALPAFTHFETLGSTTVTATGAAGLTFSGATAAGFQGKVGNITASGSSTTFNASAFANSVGSVALSATGNVTSTAGVTFNGAHGAVSQTTTSGTNTANYFSNGSAGGGYTFTSTSGAITATINAGSFDANNNGVLTSDEYGRTGNITLGGASTTGNLSLTLNASARNSDAEQATMGNVSLTTKQAVTVVNGGNDTFANGAITLTGSGTNVGAVGNVTASTNTGLITHTGTFGDIGDVTLATSEYYDLDTDPNKVGEPAVLLASGNIQLGNGAGGALAGALIVNGKHGLATYTVTEDGTINGNLVFGGAASSATSLNTTSVRGNTTIDLWLQDSTRGGLGTHGAANLTTTSGGDVVLNLGTDQNSTSNLAKNLISGLALGAVTVNVADRYTSTSATTADSLADAGNITITGVGADATNASPVGAITGHRGSIASITANTVRGNISVTGNFGDLGDTNLTVTRYADVNGANTNTFAGAITYSPAIYGTHGTSTLRTTDAGFVGTGTPTGGAISGTVTYGGPLAAGKTVSLDAQTQRANINLDVVSSGYDLNGDGKITDGVTNNVPSQFEFGKAGAIVLETTNAGDATLGLTTWTANGSTIGSAIGNVTVTANDDIYTVVDKGADTLANAAIATVIGKTAFPIAGTVGDITMNVATSTATLRGNFGNLGAVTINTATYTDASATGTGASAITAAGSIALGTQVATATTLADTATFTSLNIAGSYNDSVLSVSEMGTITGAVYVAGSGGKNWTLNAAQGGASAIAVGFIAGFDADNSGTISASEAGSLGNITATSSNRGNVTIGVGGREATSAIGNVSVSTGDTVTVNAGANDTFVKGAATVSGLSGAGLGSVGTVTGTVKTGALTLNGTFGGLAGANLTTDAYVDADTTTASNEEPVVLAAGDITLGAQIWGAHGTVTATTVDSSKLAAGKSALAGTVPDTGVISGSLIFSGGLANGTSNGVVAKTDRGNITLAIQAGFDEGAAAVYSSAEAGTVGNVSLTSVDGDINVNLDTINVGSSIGAVTATTGSTYEVKAEALDILAKRGTVTLGAAFPFQFFGSIGAVSASTVDGNISVTGYQFNAGALTVTPGTYADLDSAVGLGEAPVVINSGNATVDWRIANNHGTVTVSTVDPRADVTSTGTVTAILAVGGPLSSGTQTLVTSSEAGANASDVYADVVTFAINTQAGRTTAVDATGVAKDVSITSATGNVTSTLTTNFLAGSPNRVAEIGNVTATSGSLFSAQAANPDLFVAAGNVTLTGASQGKIGNITASTSTGTTTLTGDFVRTVGNISLTAGAYVDADTLAGAGEPSVALAAGSVVHSAQYGYLGGATTATTNAGGSTTIGTITLSAGGSTAAGGVAGSVSDTSSYNGGYRDLTVGSNVAGRIDSGELNTVTMGNYSATVTDGAITFSPVTGVLGGGYVAGHGVKLANVTLTTTGTNTVPATTITIGGGGQFSEVTSVTATAAKGNISQTGTYDAPSISGVTVRAQNGDVTVSGGYRLGMADATNNRTTNVSINGITLQSDNGNVTLSGSIGENINYGSVNLAPAGGATSDNRTASISNINLLASNGAADAGVGDGNVLVSGLIGGADVTRLESLTFTTGNSIDDTTTFNNAAANNLAAWNIGQLTFTGTTKFVSTGANPNILADDSTTTRTLNGSLAYALASSPSTPGKGSALNQIDGLTFNGAVIGSAASSLKTGTVAEIQASKIGNIVVNANVDPTSSTVFSVTNLDINAVPQGGELIAKNATVAGTTKYSTIDAFSIGNVTITHNLLGASVGSAVFSGDNAIVAGGKMGNLTITSAVKGTVQAPLFAAAAVGSAWFNVGDINGTLGTANTAAGAGGYASKTTDGTVTAGVPTAKLAIGNVTVDVGSSYTPPAVQNADIGGAGGGAGGGFAVAVAVDVNAAGNYAGDNGAGVFVPAVAIDAARALHGSAGAVSIANAAIRPDLAGNNVGAAPGTTAALPGAVVVAGDGTGAADITDIVNELAVAGVVPMIEGNYYLVGDDTAVGTADNDDVVVYVL